MGFDGKKSLQPRRPLPAAISSVDGNAQLECFNHVFGQVRLLRGLLVPVWELSSGIWIQTNR